MTRVGAAEVFTPFRPTHMPMPFPPGLHALIKTLMRPQPEPPRKRWMTDNVAASAAGFISLQRLREGGPPQRRNKSRLAHLEVHDPSDRAIMLSPTELARALNRFQRDPAFRGGDKRIPLASLARLAGVARQTANEAARGKRISDRSRLRLSVAVRSLLSGEVIFRRHGRGVRFEPVRVSQYRSSAGTGRKAA